MTAERRDLPRGNPSPLVVTLARIARQIAEREDAERTARRGKMAVMDGGRKADEAA